MNPLAWKIGNVGYVKNIGANDVRSYSFGGMKKKKRKKEKELTGRLNSRGLLS